MTTSGEVFVYAAGRTPFGRFEGSLAGHRPAELGALAIKELLLRANLPAQAVGQVIVGTAMLGGSAISVARQMVLLSDLPETTPSAGIDRACCSGMSAAASAVAQILTGSADLVIAGGVEVLSRTPRLLDRYVSRSGDLVLKDPLLLDAPVGGSIARYTSEEALKAGVDRQGQDAWALESHQRYFRAEEDGFFGTERFTIPARRPGEKAGGAMLTQDESPRRDTSLARLAELPPVRGSQTITAGNAPGLNDGAAFLLLGSAEAGRIHDLEPLARLSGSIAVAEGPTSGTRTPAIAIQRLLQRHGVDLDALAVLEINEAFAATVLVSTLVLADFDAQKAAELRRRTNPNGGAVAIGHPMGASGARIVMTAIAELRRRGGGVGVAAICGGFGQGEAMLIEV